VKATELILAFYIVRLQQRPYYRCDFGELDWQSTSQGNQSFALLVTLERPYSLELRQQLIYIGHLQQQPTAILSHLRSTLSLLDGDHLA